MTSFSRFDVAEVVILLAWPATLVIAALVFRWNNRRRVMSYLCGPVCLPLLFGVFAPAGDRSVIAAVLTGVLLLGAPTMAALAVSSVHRVRSAIPLLVTFVLASYWASLYLALGLAVELGRARL